MKPDVASFLLGAPSRSAENSHTKAYNIDQKSTVYFQWNFPPFKVFEGNVFNA